MSEEWMNEEEELRLFNARSSYSYPLAEHGIRAMVRRLEAKLKLYEGGECEAQVAALEAKLKESETLRSTMQTAAELESERADKAEKYLAALKAQFNSIVRKGTNGWYDSLHEQLTKAELSLKSCQEALAKSEAKFLEQQAGAIDYAKKWAASEAKNQELREAGDRIIGGFTEAFRNAKGLNEGEHELVGELIAVMRDLWDKALSSSPDKEPSNG